MRRTVLSLLLAALVLLPGGTAPAGTSSSRSAAVAFLDALNQHDGKAACALMVPGEQRAVGRVLFPYGTAPCPIAVRRWLAPEGDQAVFRRFANARWDAPFRLGAFIREVAEVDLITDARPDRVPIVLWLTKAGGSWRVVQSQSVLDAASSAGPDDDDTDPPADPRRVLAPSTLPRPRFACATTTTSKDPAGDEDGQSISVGAKVVETPAPWLDVLAVRSGATPAGQPCLAIDLAAAPRAGTLVDVNSSVGDEAALDLDGQGGSWAYNGGDAPLLPGTDYGVSGRTLWLLLGHDDTWDDELCVSTNQLFEPLLAHPLMAEDCVSA